MTGTVRGAGEGVPTVTVDDVRAARERVAGRVRATPLVLKEALTTRFGVPVHLKFEHLQRTGSFKLRGAVNLVEQLTPAERARGVVAASAGNHAQGVAVAAAEAGIRATIFMPRDASLAKVGATRTYGAEVVLGGANLSEAIAAAVAHAAATGAVLVHPFDDPRVVAGQGTLGLELVEQLPDLATVVIPIGGGGLFAGAAVAIHALRPDVRMVGVEVAACPSMRASLDAGHPVDVPATPTLADGIAVKQPGVVTFPLVREHLDELVVVDDDEVAAAMLWLMERAKQVVEGSAAAGLAALLSGRLDPGTGPLVCVLSGGNIDPVNLIPVVRQGLTTLGRSTVFSTRLVDRPGELVALLSLLADQGVNVLSVEHRREGVDLHVGETRVDLAVQTRNAEHRDAVLAGLTARGYGLLTPPS